MRRLPWLLSLALACQVQSAAAADLIDVWQAALQNDNAYAVGRAARAAAQPRRDQAAALWRPNVGLSSSLGVASNDTETRGAQFSAPGLGPSSGVGFSTSVRNGTSTRWALSASQPLYNPLRRAQQQQLALSADLADLEWQAAGQSLILRTAERYFDLALAGVRAQLLTAASEVQLKRNRLADSTGLPVTSLVARLPAAEPDDAAAVASQALEPWLAEAQTGNPRIRSQLLAAEVARQEARKHSLRASATVDLVAQAGRDRLSGSGDFGSASNTGSQHMIGIQLSLPLFTGGYRDAKQAEALRLAEQATAEVERTRQAVAQPVRAAWLGLSVGAERVQALAEALSASTARRDATQIGLGVGQRTTLGLLNAENDSAAAQLALAQGRVGLLLDRLRPAALVGQLDETTLRSVNVGRSGKTTSCPSNSA